MEITNFPENQNNKILIDWLSFTSKIDSDFSIFEILGLSDIKDSFEPLYGLQGYKTRLYFDGISIHYCHSKNEGVWVEMSGQGCRTFETFSKTNFTDLFKVIIYNQNNGDYHVTRLDVTYDDFGRIIPLKKLSKQILDEHFVSKFLPKSCTVTQASGRVGITCDLGSRMSKIKFRIYDKAYERGYRDKVQYNEFSWVRWEIQLRDDRAFNFMVSSLENSIGEVFKGIILFYFRVVDVNKGDSNKRRWDTSKWFLRFIGDVEKINLFTSCKTDYNLYKCERYVYTQAGNAVSALIQLKGIDTFLEELQASKPETTLKYKELINTYSTFQQADKETYEENSNNILSVLAENNL